MSDQQQNSQNTGPQNPNKGQQAQAQSQENASGAPRNMIRLAPGDYVFKEGENGEFGYIIESGSIEIGKMSGGKFVQLTVLQQGALFGEMILIDKAPRSASARALGDAVVKEIDQNGFNAYIMRNPQSAINMMQRLSSYVRSSNQALEVSVFDIPEEEKTQVEDCSENIEPKGSDEAERTIKEYQSPINEITTQKVPSVIRTTTYSMVLFFIIFVIYASFSVFDTVESVRGKVSSNMPKVKIQSTDNSVIKNIKVTLGQKVKQGDILVELDPTITNADHTNLLTDVQANEHLLERLRAEKKRLGKDGVHSISHHLHKDLYLRRLQEFDSKIATMDIGIQRTTTAYQQAETNFHIAKLDVESAIHEQKKIQRLVDEKIMHEVALRDANIGVEKAKAQHKNALASLKTSLGEYHSKIKDKEAYIASWFSSVNSQMTAALLKKKTHTQEITKMEIKRKNTVIRSPTNGVVSELDKEKMFVGAMVSSGESLVTIVPSDGIPNIELDVDSKTRPIINPGMRASIKFDAFDFQKHGDVKAELTFISEDTVEDSVSGDGKGTTYLARAKFLSENPIEELKKMEEGDRLTPGMEVTADIMVGKRRLIMVFIAPIIRTLNDSFKEH